ncbi:MAG: DEAD/DEAH box helicase [Desulfobulbaceae bacterium BRH_c16a]|nr:MAG: DEAD/DEAH box helicase [Desulfobulbaceae bacterium BRH_c16a]
MITDIAEYVASLKASSKFGPQVVCHKVYSEKDGEYDPGPLPLAAPLRECLDQSGIHRLYTHQYRAIQSILKGQDVLVATPTASGKSMIYNLPVLNDLFHENPGFSLYLFPLKALAQDQYNVLMKLFAGLPTQLQKQYDHFAALFDGDTSSYRRRKIRDSPPRVLLTNPEMLHLSLLPYHGNWRSFFGGLRYVIIDEVHSYRGVLGSHMAWVIRRLVRIAAYYGAKPTFILLSATIGNPGELGRLLLDRPVEVIADSGAPQAERNMLFINPWDSAAYTASQLLEAAVKRGLRTIVYTQSRKMTELINMWTAPKLGKLAEKLSAYRAGFLPEERREIEKMLFSGELLGVISTSALELGIDIGDLDLCILVGYPGSIMATWQRGGRVGRGRRSSATILIGQEDALDQHFMKQPEDFFRRSPESAVLNPYNTSIMDQHLQCCGAELPLSALENLLKIDAIQQRVEALFLSGALLQTASGDQWISSRKYPQRHVSLRGGGGQMAIIDGSCGEIIGEIDSVRGLKECHPGAVYLHRSNIWIVEQFDIPAGEILVRRETPSYFTRPMTEKKTEILEVFATKSSCRAQVSFGRVKVTEKVTGYQKRNNHTQKLVTTIALDLPEQTIESEGLWLDIPAQLVTLFEQEKYHFMGAIHALEHAMIALFPLLVLCDRNDIGGISCPFHVQTEKASIFIYDGYPGGVGLTREAFAKIDILLEEARQTIASCGCATGCPSCVHSPKCGSGNRPIDKQACLHLLEEILQEIQEDCRQQDPLPIACILPGKTNTSIQGASKSRDQLLGLDILPVKYGVFDLETIRSAEEVGGWNQAHKMGVSVAVVFDAELNDYVTYMEHEIEHLIKHLSSFDLVVGFNNKRFDNRVLSAYTSVDLNRLPSLDLLEEVYKYLGYRLSLNSLAEHTLGTRKTADGLQALQWYKDGRFDLIRHYCRSDVEITKNLFLHGLEQGFYLFTNKAKQKVRLPLTLEKTIGTLLNQGQSKGLKTQPVVPLL